MLIGFSKHGTGGAAKPVHYLTSETMSAGALNYLTGERGKKGIRREPHPVVVRGNPIQSRALIDSLKFKHKYTSGVLSFAPGDVVTPAAEQYIMDEFERVAFAGLDRDQYDVLWVRHTHTTSHRHEIHFLIPRVELSTGKSLNIAPPRASTRELFDTLRSKINAQYGFADPDDPTRARKEKVVGYRAKMESLKSQPANPAGQGPGLMTPVTKPNLPLAIKLEAKLAKLVETRAVYHQGRYVAKAVEPIPLIPSYDRTRIAPHGCLEAHGGGVSGARSTTWPALDRLDHASRGWREAHRRLDLAGRHLGRADRTFAGGFAQTLNGMERKQAIASLFQRHGIAANPGTKSRELSRDLEPEIEMPFRRV
jgi:hypothetical protein